MFFSGKKIAIFAIAVYYGIEYCIEYTKIPVPSFVHYLQINPIFYKLNQMVERRLYRLSNFAARTLKLGTTYGNMRLIMDFVIRTKGEKDIHASIKTQNRIINEVKTKIYTSIQSEGKIRPILIYYHGGGYVIESI